MTFEVLYDFAIFTIATRKNLEGSSYPTAPNQLRHWKGCIIKIIACGKKSHANEAIRRLLVLKKMSEISVE